MQAMHHRKKAFQNTIHYQISILLEKVILFKGSKIKINHIKIYLYMLNK